MSECRFTAQDRDPAVRGVGWCYGHRRWCGAEVVQRQPDPPMSPCGVGDRAWALRWHKREAALRNYVAWLRAPAAARRVLPSSRDDDRCAIADELEAILNAGEPIANGGLPL